MKSRAHSARKAVAIATLASLALSPAQPILSATEQQAAAPKPAAEAAKPPTPAAKPAAAASATAQPVDGGWPRSYKTASGGDVVLYQPQVSSWPNQEKMTAYSAVSYTAKAGDKPALGTVKVEADTKVSVNDRLVNFSVIRIVESNFPTLEKAQMQEVVATVGSGIPQEERVIALDRVLASLDKSQIIPKNVEGVKADPPTDLLQQDARSARQPRRRAGLEPDREQRSAATPSTPTGICSSTGRPRRYYLRNDETWLKATTIDRAVDTGRQAARQLQQAAGRRELEGRQGGRSRQEPSAAVDAEGLRQHDAGRIDPAARRAELPAASRARRLLWVSNTDSDVFRMGKAGPVYYLVAGRWFSAPDFTGPWTFATPNLPDDFKKIPARARALARARLGAGHAAGRRSGAPRAGSADGARQQEDGEGARGRVSGRCRVPADRDDHASRARSTPTRTSSRSATCTTCASRACGSCRATANGPWEVTGSVPKEIYEIPSARRRTTSPT